MQNGVSSTETTRDNTKVSRPVTPCSAISGVPQRSEGYRGGVGQQRKSCGFQRQEAQADQQRSADGDRRAESAGPLEEGPKREGDQEQLQPGIGGHINQTLLQQRKPSGFDGQVVHEDDREDDPEDRKGPVGQPVDRGQSGEPGWHVEEQQRNREPHGKRGNGRKMGLEPHYDQQQEQHSQWQRSQQGREQPMTGGVIALLPVEGGGRRLPETEQW